MPTRTTTFLLHFLAKPNQPIAATSSRSPKSTSPQSASRTLRSSSRAPRTTSKGSLRAQQIFDEAMSAIQSEPNAQATMSIAAKACTVLENFKNIVLYMLSKAFEEAYVDEPIVQVYKLLVTDKCLSDDKMYDFRPRNASVNATLFPILCKMNMEQMI